MRYLVLLLVLVLGAPTVMAEQRGRGAPAPVDRREAIKKKIRALRAYTLTEELKLDDKTSAALFPVLARWDDVTDKLLVARADLTRQLTGADAIKDPKVINKLIDDAVANQKAFWDLEDKRLAELRKILTPAQTARLVMVLPAFERRIQNQLRKAIQNRGGRGAARNATDVNRGQFDDDDDDGDPVDPYGDFRGDPLDRGNRRGPDPTPRAPAEPRGGGRVAPTPTPAPSRAPGCDPFSSRDGC